MANVIGIDFGTTKTLVSYYDFQYRIPQLIKLGRSTSKIPTSIFIEENGTFLFGEAADDQMEFGPERHKNNFKLDLGKTTPIHFVKIKGVNKRFTARELTAEFLKYIKNRCEEEVFMGGKISSATITVPVSFSPAQKEDLLKAAQDAGFIDINILKEPEAAGIAFAKEKQTDSFNSMLIVDWGGGTLDLAMVSRKDNVIKSTPNCFDGDDSMGGIVFDQALFEYVSKEVEKNDDKMHRLLSDEQVTVQCKLFKEIGKYKEKLSARATTPVALFGTKGPYPVIQVSQQDFARLIKEHIDSASSKLVALLEKIQKSGNEKPEALLMIGGSSAIPAIKERLSKVSGLKCISWHHSHEAVALGAGIHAGLKMLARSKQNGNDVNTASANRTIRLQPFPEETEEKESIESKNERDSVIGDTLQAVINNKITAEEETRNTDNTKYTNTTYTTYTSKTIDQSQCKTMEQEDAATQYNQGLCFLIGDSVTRDMMAEAVKWFRLAAEQGHADAQCRLGRCYEWGTVVAVDKVEAAKWYRKAAEQGNTDAKDRLAALTGDPSAKPTPSAKPPKSGQQDNSDDYFSICLVILVVLVVCVIMYLIIIYFPYSLGIVCSGIMIYKWFRGKS